MERNFRIQKLKKNTRDAINNVQWTAKYSHP
jgi:hypothetical protein